MRCRGEAANGLFVGWKPVGEPGIDLAELGIPNAYSAYSFLAADSMACAFTSSRAMSRAIFNGAVSRTV